MKKFEIILNGLCAVLVVLALVALAMPAYTISAEGIENITLSDLTFGDGDVFKSHIFLMVPFILNIVGLALIAVEFIPHVKGKQIFRIAALFIFAVSGSCYMAAGTSYNCDDSVRTVVSQLLKAYDKGYAGTIAGIAAIAAGIVQFGIFAKIHKQNKEAKTEQ